jgi:uridine kinase
MSPADRLVAQLRDMLDRGGTPLFVGIDGGSGSGKSTLASAVTDRLRDGADPVATTVIDGDDFYLGGSAAQWDRRSAAQNADRVIDWRHQREVLQALRRDGAAQWAPFDWDAETWETDEPPHVATPVLVRAAPVVILEGVYSCRPELHDLLDLRVLVDVPRLVVEQRVRAREGEDHRPDWERRWRRAEDHYFDVTMTPERFDMVLG